MKNTIITAVLLLASLNGYSQVGIGTTSPNASAALDITSTTKGLLPPRMTTAERNAIASPTLGLVIFNSTTNSLEIKNSTGWTSMVAVNPTAAGDMIYWNGTTWTRVPAGTNGQTLTFISNIPVWTGFLPANTVFSNGKIWMDRNLGATQVATSSTDAASYGYSYQWGRGNDGHQIRSSSPVTSIQSSTDVPGNNSFITSSTDWRSTQNDNLWQGVNGVNNPCPSGYRIPTMAEWTVESTSWSSQNSAGAFNSPLKLLMAGHRADTVGDVRNTNAYGDYWSSTVSGIYSSFLRFTSGAVSVVSWTRSSGFSVRCIKE